MHDFDIYSAVCDGGTWTTLGGGEGNLPNWREKMEGTIHDKKMEGMLREPNNLFGLILNY